MFPYKPGCVIYHGVGVDGRNWHQVVPWKDYRVLERYICYINRNLTSEQYNFDFILGKEPLETAAGVGPAKILIQSSWPFLNSCLESWLISMGVSGLQNVPLSHGPYTFQTFWEEHFSRTKEIQPYKWCVLYKCQIYMCQQSYDR